MGSEDIFTVKRTSRATASRLKQERERHSWTQSQVAERIGTTQINISRWENGITTPGLYYRQKLAELFGRTLEELGFLLEVEDSSNVSSLTLSQAHQTIWNIPYRRNPFFTGREEILTYLYNILINSKAAVLTQAQAITGLGGVGKTQIAVEYAYRYCNHYDAMLWVTASSYDTFMADFVMLATLLPLPEQNERDPEIVVAAVKRWLTTHTNWLLILDNVDDLKLVTKFLPMHSEGNVLLTTRLQALGAIAKSIEVEKMGMEEGILFLLRRAKVLEAGMPLAHVTREEQSQAADIVTALDGLPLALDQAGAYIEETRCGFQGYFSLYRTRRKELLQRRGTLPTDHPESVAATWSLSFQQVGQISPAATDLLYLFAFLHPEAIPEELLTAGAAELGPILGPIAPDPLKIDGTIETLLSYSLIQRNPDAHLLSIHRLVQAVLKDALDINLQRTWAERSIRATNRAFPDVDFTTWDQCRRCLPHAQTSATYLEEYGLAFPEVVRLLNQAATYLTVHAQYAQAEALLQKALAICKQILEPVHPDTALTLNELARLYRAQGEYAKAESLYLQALDIQESLLGPDHPDVAQTLNNLARLYRAQGAYAQAEPRYQRALAIRQRVFGPDHHLVAESLYSIAKLSYSQGKYAQAAKLCQQALQIQEQRLGLDHPDVAFTLAMLARVYKAQSKYAQAEELYERALTIRERTLGLDHPLVALILSSLAEVYQAQGKYLEAGPLISRSLAIREQSLGREHPYVAYSLSNLAENYFAQGNFTQAELLYKEALTIREQALGSAHPQAASTYHSLATLYFTLGRYQEAEALYHKALAIREQTLGPEHFDVATSLEHYATLLRKTEREQLAFELEVRAKAMRAKQSQSESS